MSSFKQQLIEMEVCDDAVKWVGRKSLKTAWAKCERGDWMLWLAGRLDVDRKLLVLAACDCAEQVLKFVPDGEDRPRIAIETARALCNSDATIEQVKAAAHAAHAAYAVCAVYAAHAAYAADAVYVASLKTSADLVRARIPFDVINSAQEQKP